LSAVPATRAALEAAAELAQRVMQDQKSTQEDMETAAAVLEHPVCAAGVLRSTEGPLCPGGMQGCVAGVGMQEMS